MCAMSTVANNDYNGKLLRILCHSINVLLEVVELSNIYVSSRPHPSIFEFHRMLLYCTLDIYHTNIQPDHDFQKTSWRRYVRRGEKEHPPAISPVAVPVVKLEVRRQKVFIATVLSNESCYYFSRRSMSDSSKSRFTHLSRLHWTTEQAFRLTTDIILAAVDCVHNKL
jgi:hypothetical protein